jgi:hypothetical protein
MTADSHSARDDLAFLRTLVEAGDTYYRPFGEAYFAAGLIYGAQMLMHAGQALGLLPVSSPWGLLIGIGPTVVFIPVIVWINWRHRKIRPNPVGRAVSIVFAAVGMANLALVAVVGSVAWREHSITTWLIYPCAVFVLQGAAWLVAWALRRRAWLGLVALGWFVTAVGMAVAVQSFGYYILFGGLGIWICMALPGWLMIRLARKTG